MQRTVEQIERKRMEMSCCAYCTGFLIQCVFFHVSIVNIWFTFVFIYRTFFISQFDLPTKHFYFSLSKYQNKKRNSPIRCLKEYLCAPIRHITPKNACDTKEQYKNQVEQIKRKHTVLFDIWLWRSCRHFHHSFIFMCFFIFKLRI